MRDQFTIDAAPMVSGPATPKGTRTVSGTGLSIVNGRMRGGAAAGVVHYGGMARVAGRTLCVQVTPEDASATIEISFSETAGAVDGYVLRATSKRYQVEMPDGTAINVTKPEGISFHAATQLLGVTLRQDAGAVFWVAQLASIPGVSGEWPMYGQSICRILFATTQASAATLYPTISTTSAFAGYSYFEDARVIDVPDWQDSTDMALAADRFDRANAADLGAAWTEDSGAFGVDNQQAYPITSNLAAQAWLEAGQKNAMVVCSWRTDDALACLAEIHARRSDAAANTNVFFYQAGANLYMETQNAGAFNVLEATGALPQVAATWYQVVFGLLEASYRAWVINPTGANIAFGPKTDPGPAQNGTKFGIAHYQNPPGPVAQRVRWDTFAVYPISTALPSVITNGASARLPTTGATISTDSFIAADGTLLESYNAAWQRDAGTWDIYTNQARNTDTGGVNYRATRDSGALDIEISADITLAATLTRLRSGIIFRDTGGGAYGYARLFVDPAQPASHELEVWHSDGTLLKKQDLGVYFVAAQTYTLRLQCIGDMLHVYIDAMPVLSIVLPSGLQAGMRAGLYRRGNDGGACDVTSWDNFTIKTLT